MAPPAPAPSILARLASGVPEGVPLPPAAAAAASAPKPSPPTAHELELDDEDELEEEDDDDEPPAATAFLAFQAFQAFHQFISLSMLSYRTLLQVEPLALTSVPAFTGGSRLITAVPCSLLPLAREFLQARASARSAA